MKQIKTKSGDIIIISISEQIPINRPDGITLGKFSELTDKDCKEFVDIPFKGEYWLDYDAAIDYIYELKSAKESFISLLQSEGIDASKEYLIIKML